MATATAEAERERTEEEKKELEAGDEVVQISIEGDEDLTLTVGGLKPDEATLKFGGGEIQMRKSQFKKGQRVAILLVGPITEVSNKDLIDPKTKKYTKAKKTHTLTPDDIRRVPLELVEGLEATA